MEGAEHASTYRDPECPVADLHGPRTGPRLAQTKERPKEQATASILDGGSSATGLTRKQAADIEFAVGRSAEEQGQFPEAEKSYLAALKKDPSRADAEVRLAILRDRKGDPAAADKHFARR